jgi:hypothetical protein
MKALVFTRKRQKFQRPLMWSGPRWPRPIPVKAGHKPFPQPKWRLLTSLCNRSLWSRLSIDGPEKSQRYGAVTTGSGALSGFSGLQNRARQ